MGAGYKDLPFVQRDYAVFVVTGDCRQLVAIAKLAGIGQNINRGHSLYNRKRRGYGHCIIVFFADYGCYFIDAHILEGEGGVPFFGTVCVLNAGAGKNSVRREGYFAAGIDKCLAVEDVFDGVHIGGDYFVFLYAIGLVGVEIAVKDVDNNLEASHIFVVAKYRERMGYRPAVADNGYMHIIALPVARAVYQALYRKLAEGYFRHSWADFIEHFIG